MELLIKEQETIVKQIGELDEKIKYFNSKIVDAYIEGQKSCYKRHLKSYNKIRKVYQHQLQKVIKKLIKLNQVDDELPELNDEEDF